jgi:hypothetical protein
MASLTAHLLESGDHGRLGFRSDCPVCREQRLCGALLAERLVSRRARAALASGVLAVSAAAPAVAVAQEPDQVQEGVVVPEQPDAVQPDGTETDGAPTDSPGFDPGGETPLPFDVGTPPAAPQDNEPPTPLESEPVDDPDARLVPLEEPEPDAEVPEPEADVPVPPAEPPAPPPLDAVPAPPAPPPLPPPIEPPAVAPKDGPDATPPKKEPDRQTQADAPNRSQAPPPQPPTTTAPPIEPAPAPAPQPAPATVLVQATNTGPTAEAPASPLPDTARTHVVQSGESLWTIAERLLGARASTARVAREVDRLWELNKDRIATGDPDLLMTGTELRLR